MPTCSQGMYIPVSSSRRRRGPASCIRKYPHPNQKERHDGVFKKSNYYRRFIPNYTSIAVPLTDSTKKEIPRRASWTAEMYQSFHALKKALISNQVLASPDPTCPFVLQTDASSIGIGPVLSQLLMRESNDRWLYYSQKLLPRERHSTLLPSKNARPWWTV